MVTGSADQESATNRTKNQTLLYNHVDLDEPDLTRADLGQLAEASRPQAPEVTA